MASPRKHSRRTRGLAALILFAFVFTACSGGGGEEDSGDNSSGGTLTIGWPSGPSTGINMTSDYGEPSITVQYELFRGLVSFSPDGREVVPDLASDWTISDDYLSYAFTLRPDLKFSDGSPIRQEDVVFSLNEARSTDSVFGYLFEMVTDVAAEGEDQVVITLSRPYQPLLEYLAEWHAGIVPENYGGKSPEEFYREPVSSGPWVLEEWTRGQQLSLVPNPNWYGDAPKLDKVVYRDVPDEQARVLQLMSDQVDAIADVSTGSLESLRANSEVSVEIFPFNNNPVLLLNNEVPALGDPKVRQAISLAIDREGLVAAVTAGEGEVASAFSSNMLSRDPLPPLPTDLDAAQQLMADSDYPDGFNLEIVHSITQFGASTTAQILADQLKPLGITVELRPQEAGSFTGLLAESDFEAAVVADLYSAVPSLAELAKVFVDLGGFWTNPDILDEVGETFGQAFETFDDQSREELYNNGLETINSDASVIGLFQTPKFWAMREGGVSGLDINFLGRYDLSKVEVN